MKNEKSKTFVKFLLLAKRNLGLWEINPNAIALGLKNLWNIKASLWILLLCDFHLCLILFIKQDYSSKIMLIRLISSTP
jgi:hypothetical protein